MSLEDLNKQVKKDLSFLNIPEQSWLKSDTHNDSHVYDAIIIGAGQSGLGAAFALMREKITNILVIDENKEGSEGPWETYARMMTLRTPKKLTSIDLGIPSLTFRAWWEAQFGESGWDALDKIPRHDWMNYLRWYRQILRIPVKNEVTLKLIEPIKQGVFQLHTTEQGKHSELLLARKVILATGIQGGGEWHVPDFITNHVPREYYAHTSSSIDFSLLQDKKIAILGGGASAFDNANFALTAGVKEADVFMRRKDFPRINPIRFMEPSGMIDRYHTFSDQQKYKIMAHFFQHNQPPTNDTYDRASTKQGFHLHIGEPWKKVEAADNGVKVYTDKGAYDFDFLLVSTGLITDPALRPELKLIEPYILRWADCYNAPAENANPLLDAHPYLSEGFALQAKEKKWEKLIHGIFAFNYSAIINSGLSASALSGLRFALPKLASAVADQLFMEEQDKILADYFEYKEEEFTGTITAEKEMLIKG
ncbi:SidA/IucD/PvdA family monooxygenase [Gracilibacillus oryzae]|uniref:SidA/IucD/PvdA family monooxygenase n=1 Tax=Gracilibacillus oryzae TaxID=1672701 RepID=A0A7C8KTQ6_9BACI|nr:NAD(P)/FAD-dependent oxidoreductase [Gracilibacillus oryzae]KAB8138258.1 SidA/IucD/PvdA family monooxygenase [Gracilibacillus oryzae]